MSLFQSVFKGDESLLNDVDSLRKGTLQFTTRSVEMTATIKETGSNLIAGEIVYRTQTNPYHLLLRVLT